MIAKLTEALRRNTWLIVAGCLAFVASAYVGALTVDAGSSTPAVWLGAMWMMLAMGALIMVVVIVDAVQSAIGS